MALMVSTERVRQALFEAVLFGRSQEALTFADHKPRNLDDFINIKIVELTKTVDNNA